MSSLQNNVADFGAKLQELSLQVNSLNNYTREDKLSKEGDRVLLTQLQQSIALHSNTSTGSDNNNNRTQELLDSLKVEIFKELKNMSSTLASINDTLSQKTTVINDELRIHKVTFVPTY